MYCSVLLEHNYSLTSLIKGHPDGHSIMFVCFLYFVFKRIDILLNFHSIQFINNESYVLQRIV